MSLLREKLPDSHIFLSLSRGNRVNTLAIRPIAFYGFWAIIALICLWSIGLSCYFLCHDNVILALLARQSDMQSAYEDRLAMMRSEVDRATTQQMLNQDTLEGKLQQLLMRQMQLENRSKVVASLAAVAGVKDPTPTATLPKNAAEAIATIDKKIDKNSSLISRSSPPAPATPAITTTGLGYAPLDSISVNTSRNAVLPPLKPHPENDDLPMRSTNGPEIQGNALPVNQQLDRIKADLDLIDGQQVRALSALEAPARETAARITTALSDAGLSIDRLDKANDKSSAIGGPFIPLKVDPNGSLFDRQVYHLQGTIAAVDRLRKVLPRLPLRQPLHGALEVTSGFGYRTDPFLGRPALHPGIDFREEYGSPIRATAAGKVVTAAMTGGYGNMVEIDHGNGLVTRYGHMSQILVTEGEWVESGAILGKIGSTGRSTGPHLHYEVRVDDEAVDPGRFLHAGLRLNPGE